MNKIQELTNKLAALYGHLSKYAMRTSDKGIIQFDGEKPEVGKTVLLVDEDGNQSRAEDGKYTLEDGVILVVENSTIVEVIIPEPEVPAEEEMAEEEPATEEPKADEPEQTEIEKLREEVNELYKIVDSILEKIGESRKEADEYNKTIEERLSIVEKTAQVEPIETPKKEVKLSKEVEYQQKLNKMFRK